MRVLVTGATGLVGFNTVQALLRRGHTVRALVRSMDKGRHWLPETVELVQGDVTNPGSLKRALSGMEWVFHSAGFPEQWFRDPGMFDRVNVGGTQNVIDAALEAKIKRLVYTSTIDVFTWRKGLTYDERELDPNPKVTPYERSKQEADRRAQAALERGLDAVFLHPSGVYGPGPTDSPGINDMVRRLARNELPSLLPGGLPVVFAPDVGEGHVLAAERAARGSRFILSESYVPLRELARIVLEELGQQRPPPGVLPLRVAQLVALVGEVIANWTGRPPLIPRGQLQFLQVGAIPVSEAARRELGWKPTPLREGLRQTIPFVLGRSRTS